MADLFLEIPGLGFLLKKTARAETYYMVDYIENIQRSVHASILRIVDDLREENGFPVLLNEERTPIWEEIW